MYVCLPSYIAASRLYSAFPFGLKGSEKVAFPFNCLYTKDLLLQLVRDFNLISETIVEHFLNLYELFACYIVGECIDFVHWRVSCSPSLRNTSALALYCMFFFDVISGYIHIVKLLQVNGAVNSSK